MSTDAKATTDASPLDEVMMAMDVVDTLRRGERLAERELDTAGRERDLLERLRAIYQAQGIAVSDQLLVEGVAALREERFVYKPATTGWRIGLARLYVSRGRWGRWLLGGIAALLVVWAIAYFVFVAPNAALPERLAAAHAEVLELAGSARARTRAEQLLTAGQSAVREADPQAARAALHALEQLRLILGQVYNVRIVNRPGERSGVWRVPDVNSGARNYYLIVEAVDPAGRVLSVPITSEETGQTEQVTHWGLRVDRATFERVARDKRDDGIIEQDQIGSKRRGELAPDYSLHTPGGTIIQW